MKRVILSVFIVILISCKDKSNPKPNIVFIMSDDHTSQAWGIYGGVLSEYVKNDGIKRLANNGTVLNNLFCTNSICVPSRASILTGKYSHINGVYNLPDALSPDSLNIAKILKENGYQTSIIGKWHLKKNHLDLIIIKYYQVKVYIMILISRLLKIGKMVIQVEKKKKVFQQI